MQILLIQSISYCVDHLLIMFVKYYIKGLAKEAFFIGFNAYAILTALIIYAFVTILMGKETNLPFFDNAIQFDIKARNKGESIL